jgi:hypothetical protein
MEEFLKRFFKDLLNRKSREETNKLLHIKAVMNLEENHNPINDFLEKVVVIEDDSLSETERNQIEFFIFSWMDGIDKLDITYRTFLLFARFTKLTDEIKCDPYFEEFVKTIKLIMSKFQEQDPEHAKVFLTLLPKRNI